MTTTTTPPPPTTGRWRRAIGGFHELGPAGPVALLLLVALAGVQSFDIVAFGVLSPDIRQTFHVSNTVIDSIAGLTSAVPVIFAIAMGYLGDRGNRLRIARWAGLVWAVTAIGTGLAPVIGLLIAARLVGGIGYLTTETVYPSLLSDYYPPQRSGWVFGAYRLGSQGLALIGGPAAGALGAIFGWRAAFIVLAVPTFVFVALLSVLREPARGASQGMSLGGEAMGSVTEGFRRVRAIGTLRRTWVAAFLFGAGTLPFPTLLNNFFHDVYRLGDTARGNVSALYGVGGLAGIALGAWLTQKAVTQGKLSRLPILNGFMVVEFALGIVVMAGSPALGGSVLGAGLLSIGAVGFLPAYTALVALVAPARLRAQAYAWSLLWYALGGVLLSVVIGGISDSHGNRVALLVLAGLVGTGGLIGASAWRFVGRDLALASSVETAAGSDALLSCTGIDAGYGGVQILFGVDFEIREGEIVALLGTNGAGKSTFLKTVSGLLDPTGGAMFYRGRDITHADPQTTAQLGIMHVPGGRGIFPTLSVAENLRVAGWLFRGDRAYLDEAMARVKSYFPVLDERADTLAGDLSGGEQQMLSLAQAFLAKPDLLLIDELSLGLAPAIVERLLEIVRAIHAQGTTVILVEQSVSTALRIAERAIFMEKGEVRFSGPTADLLERPDILRAVFLAGAAGGKLLTSAAANGNGNGVHAAIPAAGYPIDAHASINGNGNGNGTGNGNGNGKSKGRARGRAASVADRPVVMEALELVKRYGGVTAVDHVSFTLHDGEILGFVGHNGAGKTTLFDVVSGFTPRNGGRVLLGEQDLSEWPAHRRAAAGLGRSFQDARLWPQLTVAECLAVALHGEAEIEAAFPALLGLPRVAESEAMVAERVDELIDLMGLEAFRNKFISELSTGSRRMVELGCVLAHRPKVLLLDEPSSGIAQRETEALGPLIKRIRDQLACSILIIEHDMPLISSLADNLIALDLGRVIAYGPPRQVLDDPAVIESYLGGAVEQQPKKRRPPDRRRRTAAGAGT
ncbi:MAG TPA: MFS transporter [Mycobacteriales bacterium]|nr:MFS transporter [Mycobacteriales bacterium]